MNRKYYDIMESILEGDLDSLKEYEKTIEDFPAGKDHFIERHWIRNAIDCGTLEVVEWMLTKGVSLTFRDDEGYTVLHSAIDREKEGKYEVMRLLLQHGANVNAKGIDGWTPSHMAGVRGDLEALKILKKFGANLKIRTEIDDYATPYEEALNCGKNKQVIAWLKENSK